MEGEGILGGAGTVHRPWATDHVFAPIRASTFAPSITCRESVVESVHFLAMIATVIVVLHLTSSEHAIGTFQKWRKEVFGEE
jgi:hypothetical protein